FRDERRILRRDLDRVFIDRLADDSLMKLGPVELLPELPRDGSLRIVAITAQIPVVDTPPQGEDRGKHSFKEFLLRLLYRRHVLQDIFDNCHRPLAGFCVVRTHIQPVRGLFFYSLSLKICPKYCLRNYETVPEAM